MVVVEDTLAWTPEKSLQNREWICSPITESHIIGAFDSTLAEPNPEDAFDSPEIVSHSPTSTSGFHPVLSPIDEKSEILQSDAFHVENSRVLSRTASRSPVNQSATIATPAKPLLSSVGEDEEYPALNESKLDGSTGIVHREIVKGAHKVSLSTLNSREPSKPDPHKAESPSGGQILGCILAFLLFTSGLCSVVYAVHLFIVTRRGCDEDEDDLVGKVEEGDPEEMDDSDGDR